MGIGGSSKVVFSKYQKQAFIKQAENRELVSLIEAIRISGQQLPLFVILKGKKSKDNQSINNIQLDNRISLGDNGWTDNKLCIKWLKECFELATRAKLQGKYWLLIVDGYVFHILSKFIKFVKTNQIISLCLPSHWRHLL